MASNRGPLPGLLLNEVMRRGSLSRGYKGYIRVIYKGFKGCTAKLYGTKDQNKETEMETEVLGGSRSIGISEP